MGERKVINKYYPPHFDAAKLPRFRRPQNDSMKVRMMLPMSVRCNSCAHYLYKGTKFDMIKQIAEQKYLNVISIHTFYFKCTHCKAHIVFRTDPQNSDYVVLNGASRNFEPWRAQPEEKTDEGQDAMESLESQSSDNKREMRIDAQLDELKCLKSRQAKLINSDTLLHLLAEKTKKLEEAEEEDEALVRSVFGQNSKVLRRVRDDDDVDDDNFNPVRKKVSYQISSNFPDSQRKSNASGGCKLPMLSRNLHTCLIFTR